MLAVALAYFIWESRVADRSESDAASAQTQTADDITAVMPDDRSVAVLPFANRSRLEDDMFFTDGRAYQLCTRALVLALCGHSDAAIEAAREASTFYPLDVDHWEAPNIHACAAHALAIAGERDETVRILRKTIDLPGEYSRWRLYLDPRWDFFRDDERFNELARPANLDESSVVRKPLQPLRIPLRRSGFRGCRKTAFWSASRP